jgi:serine/threonine-protein kinase HipA
MKRAMAEYVDVFYENIRIARIAKTDAGPALVYEDAWRSRKAAFPISLSMPLAESGHGGRTIMPWLANLLPESHLHEIGLIMGVHSQDVLGILSRMGRDTAGALSIGQPRGSGGRLVPIETEADLERVIDDLPERPFLVGTEGVSMSLAGAQDKIAVSVAAGTICIPLEGEPSTHILKPDIPRLKGSVQNEAFCLTLAGMCGLETAKVTTGKAGARSYLLVERYDRLKDAGGQVRRIHQEDLAQVLGYYPVQKYETPPPESMVGPGPGLKQLFAAVADHVSPGERLKLLDGLIFNVLACNTDAHAKNYSLMIGARGTAKLAPLYDIMCGEVWPTITKHMAQRIGDRSEAVHIRGDDWKKLAAEVGLNPAATLRRVTELCELVREHASAAKNAVAAMPAGGNQILDNVEHEVLKRVRRISNQLGTVPRMHAESGEPPESATSTAFDR